GKPVRGHAQLCVHARQGGDAQGADAARVVLPAVQRAEDIQDRNSEWAWRRPTGAASVDDCEALTALVRLESSRPVSSSILAFSLTPPAEPPNLSARR